MKTKLGLCPFFFMRWYCKKIDKCEDAWVVICPVLALRNKLLCFSVWRKKNVYCELVDNNDHECFFCILICTEKKTKFFFVWRHVELDDLT
jgi:hypothetical protein